MPTNIQANDSDRHNSQVAAQRISFPLLTPVSVQSLLIQGLLILLSADLDSGNLQLHPAVSWSNIAISTPADPNQLNLSLPIHSTALDIVLLRYTRSSRAEEFIGMNGDGLTTGRGLPLTSERVSLVPKRNAQQYLQVYTDNQRRLSANYIHEACHDFDHCGPAGHRFGYEQEDSEKLRDFAFGTPILKPRVSILPGTKTTNNINKACELPASQLSDHRSIVKETDKKKRAHSPTLEESSRQGIENHSIKLARRRVQIGAEAKENNAEIDDDHAKRLEERRKRRKSKKDVMQPPTSKSQKSRERPNKNKKENQTKDAQIGFALMHGFTATNVGKNRLTLEPTRDVGVFKKGKASRKASVFKKQEKKQDKHRYCFSEAKFLNAKPSRENESQPSSSSSTLSDGETISSNGRKIGAGKIAPTQDDTIDKSVRGVVKSPVPTIQNRPPYDPAESVVWNIEKNSNVVLNSDSHTNGPRSIHVRCPSDFIKVTPKPQVLSQTTSSFKDPLRLSSPNGSQSLAPSQSASQVAQRAHQVAETPKDNAEVSASLSKYFKQNVNASVQEQLVLDPPALTQKETKADHRGLDDYLSPSLNDELTPLDPIENSGDMCSTRRLKQGDPMQALQNYPCFEVVDSPSAPMGKFSDIVPDPGLSKCCVFTTGPALDEPSDDAPSMYCPSPVIWFPSNMDDHSLEADYDGFTYDSLQGHQYSTNVSDVDWKEISSDAGNFTDIDWDRFSDEYFESRPDSLPGLFEMPHDLDPDLSHHVHPHLQYTEQNHPVFNQGDSPTRDCEAGHDIYIAEATLCCDENLSELSLSDSYPGNEDDVLGDNFCQGRDLLHCYNSGLPPKIPNPEAEVAQLLTGCHWLPQRF